MYEKSFASSCQPQARRYEDTTYGLQVLLLCPFKKLVQGLYHVPDFLHRRKSRSVLSYVVVIDIGRNVHNNSWYWGSGYLFFVHQSLKATQKRWAFLKLLSLSFANIFSPSIMARTSKHISKQETSSVVSLTVV